MPLPPIIMLCNYSRLRVFAVRVHQTALHLYVLPWSTLIGSPQESQYSANSPSKHCRQYGRPSLMMYRWPPSCLSHSRHAKCFICHARPSASVHSSARMICVHNNDKSQQRLRNYKTYDDRARATVAAAADTDIDWTRRYGNASMVRVRVLRYA